MVLNISVIYGSYRRDRLGIRAANFIIKKLKENKHNVTFIDAIKENLPILDRMHKEYSEGKAPKNMEKISKILKKSDAFIFISGEYNHSIQPGLKNLIDHFQTEYFFKPAGIACYSPGPFGGVRAAIHIRSILGELGMVTLPSFFPISSIHKSFDENGNTTEEGESYNRRIKKFLDELEWYANSLKKSREKGVPY